MNKAVFLDRDGTVSVEMGYIHEKDLGEYKLEQGAAAGIAALSKGGFKCLLTTNQSGVARGYYPESMVGKVHDKLEDLLGAERAGLDGIYYCPHHPDPLSAADNGQRPRGMVAALPRRELAIRCECRKPGPGMGLRAKEDFDLDLAQCWVVGDKAADLGLAKNLGARGVLVMTGYGKETLEKLKAKGEAPALTAANLEEAARIILKESA